MRKENSRKEILESVKKFVQQSEEKQRIQMITDAIGERRDRDLLDILSQIEQDWGWQELINHLLKSRNFQYSLPIGVGPIRVEPEELKFRESIFSILTCDGLEAVSITTDDLLVTLQNADSLVDASSIARNHIEAIVTSQIESGDLLFFDTTHFDNLISRSLIESIENAQQNQAQSISINQIGDRYDILPLWYNEIGRQTLSSIGIRGSHISSEQLDTVLSVLPISIERESTSNQTSLIEPSNLVYRRLLNSIINQNLDTLSILSSKFSYPVLESILEESLDHYTKEQTSEGYRTVLAAINAHIRIRVIDSISIMEQLAYSKNPRIATMAITALGNYYHESAASALVDLLCSTKNKEITIATINAIKNVSKRCPETKFVIINTIESESCTQRKHLKRLRKEIGGKKTFYY